MDNIYTDTDLSVMGHFWPTDISVRFYFCIVRQQQVNWLLRIFNVGLATELNPPVDCFYENITSPGNVDNFIFSSTKLVLSNN